MGTVAPSLRNAVGSLRKATTSWSSDFASSTPAMSSQPTDDLADGLICAGLVLGIIFSVRQKKKTIANMNSSVATPDHSRPKVLTSSKKLLAAIIIGVIGSPPKPLSPADAS